MATVKDHIIRPADTIESRFEITVERIKDNYLLRTDDDKFRAAVGALLLSYDNDSFEFQHVNIETQRLRKLQIIISAAIEGIEVKFPEQDEEELAKYPPIGLLKIFREVMNLS